MVVGAAEEVEVMDEVVVVMSGSLGSGQVMSLHSSEQNSLILYMQLT